MRSLTHKIPRNASLLVVLIVLILVSPLVSEESGWFLGELMFDAILLAGVYSAADDRHRWPFLVLTAVTLAVRWGELLLGIRGFNTGALTLTLAWLVYAITIIVGDLFRRREVTVDTILGAMVTYLLIAVAFMFVFQLLEIVSPGALSGIPEEARQSRARLVDGLMYFSLVCLTTMGYGDIVPVSGLARPLAVLEGVIGQLYLAVMIARLVGLHIAEQSMPRD
ncbi:MAG: potassium channel family protein [Polyangiales bacterium]